MEKAVVMIAERRRAAARLYPAITACIVEERAPSRAEVRLVASRIWREGLVRRAGDPTPISAMRFGERRSLVRAAIAALSGSDQPPQPPTAEPLPPLI